jgi:hypothetical protein
MTRLCCAGGGSILPAVLLVLLPKCPLCLAAWLTVATGVSFSAVVASWVRVALVVFWVGAVVALARRGGRERPPRPGGPAPPALT